MEQACNARFDPMMLVSHTMDDDDDDTVVLSSTMLAMPPLHGTGATRILSAVNSDRNDMLVRPA